MDDSAITQLMVDLGRPGAEEVINRDMEDIAMRLTELEMLHDAGEHDALWKTSKGMIGIAERIGLPDLADAARAVANASRCGDPIALSATIARVGRVGDLSLSAIWATPGVCL